MSVYAVLTSSFAHVAANAHIPYVRPELKDKGVSPIESFTSDSDPRSR